MSQSEHAATSPTEPTDSVSLPSLAAELLEQARDRPAGRAARTIVSVGSLRGTVIALTEGSELAEHDSPPAATLHVISGRARLHTTDRAWDLDAGDLVGIPPQRHALRAVTDAVVLLTVALR